MKYKLIKRYPSLPNDWQEGMIVGQGDRGSFSYYSPCNGLLTELEIAKQEVENNPEFWTAYKFTTEDGVNIYQGDFYCPVVNGNVWDMVKSHGEGYGKSDNIIRFSTKQAALKWIEENKEPEYKVGEWLYVTNGRPESIFRFKSMKGDTDEAYQTYINTDKILFSGGHECWADMKSTTYKVTKATKEQIERILTKVAISKGFVKGVKFKSLVNDKWSNTIDDLHNIKYYESRDQLSISFNDKEPISNIYLQGKWAEIIQEPKLTFGGHDVEFTMGNTDVMVKCLNQRFSYVIDLLPYYNFVTNPKIGNFEVNYMGESNLKHTFLGIECIEEATWSEFEKIILECKRLLDEAK